MSYDIMDPTNILLFKGVIDAIVSLSRMNSIYMSLVKTMMMMYHNTHYSIAHSWTRCSLLARQSRSFPNLETRYLYAWKL